MVGKHAGNHIPNAGKGIGRGVDALRAGKGGRIYPVVKLLPGGGKALPGGFRKVIRHNERGADLPGEAGENFAVDGGGGETTAQRNGQKAKNQEERRHAEQCFHK